MYAIYPLQSTNLHITVCGMLIEREGQGVGRRRRAKGQAVLNERCATSVDHVLVEGMTMREARQRVQPKSRFKIASIIRTFREENM